MQAIEWSPAGASSTRVATGSLDGTAKLWDPSGGPALYTFAGHKEPCYSLGFSPDGKYLCTGGFDGQVLVWSVGDGALVRRHKGESSVYDISWHHGGSHVAAATGDGAVVVLDVRM